MQHLKICFLYISKWLGLFHFSKYIYRNKLNILAYHGFSYCDEHRYRPKLFLTPYTFEKRLKSIKSNNFKVLSLSEGIDRLYNDTLPHNSIVITIDDGFHSVAELAAPLLKKYELPATVYVTTYYHTKGSPIFKLLIRYMIWKSNIDEQTAAGILTQLIEADLPPDKLRNAIKYCETNFSEPERISLSKAFAEKLGHDYEKLADSSILSIMNKPELKKMKEQGIDIQLHTHRHRMPLNPNRLSAEITENRAILEPITGVALNHICYPCGIWDAQQWDTLKKLNIISATTCEPGLNSPDINPLALNRFLDSECCPQIEFEAELFGYKDLLRSIVSFFRAKHS